MFHLSFELTHIKERSNFQIKKTINLNKRTRKISWNVDPAQQRPTKSRHNQSTLVKAVQRLCSSLSRSDLMITLMIHQVCEDEKNNVNLQFVPDNTHISLTGHIEKTRNVMLLCVNVTHCSWCSIQLKIVANCNY